MNLWIVFITGLTVGGLTCLAVQGGLLASVIAANEDEELERKVNHKNPIFPTLAFLVTKFIAYVILGFLLGVFGDSIGINQKTQVIMQLVAGLYMIAIALNLLNIHPIFRYAVIQPPRFLARIVRNKSKSKELFAPAMLGAMTIFIPCGTTLAMEALAISTADPISGAAVMGVFVLGTTPLFFGVGFLTSVLGDNFRKKFLKVAAVSLIYLGIVSINGSLVAAGSSVSLGSVSNLFKLSTKETDQTLYDQAQVSQGAEIFITTSGYSPNYIKVRKGSPVTIKLTGKDAYGCASAFRIPELGISKNLMPNESYTFSFTPERVGKISFSCSMGMYSGVIEVI